MEFRMTFHAIERETIPDTSTERFLPSNNKDIKILRDSHIIFGGLSQLDKGFYAERPTYNDHHTLIITMSGYGTFEMENGEIFELGPGQLFLSPVGSIGHKHYPSKGIWDIAWLRIKKEALWLNSESPNHIMRPCHNYREIYSAIDKLIIESLLNESGSMRLQELYAEMLYLYLRREFSISLSPETDEIRYRINRLWNMVNAQLADSWSVEKMAEIVGLSRTHFFRQCKQIYGMTPGDKVKSLKMIRAEQLLTNLNSPMYIISESIGYENPNSFISAFKAYFGMSPKKYRNHIHSDLLKK
jgi:AraC family transcriptional regulator of arabinose operon